MSRTREIVEKELKKYGYHPRRGDILFLNILLSQKGIKAGLLLGAPGTGKTFLGRVLAKILGGNLIYFLAHHWVSEEDLFVKLDPARVASLAGGRDGEPEEAYRPGVLLRAVQSSWDRPTVLLLDEWDKAPQRADTLLLEFLQTGRVIGPFGEEWEATRENLVVILTSNELRSLAEPLLRRVYRYRMGFLPPNVEADLIRKNSGVPATISKLIVAGMNIIRNDGVTTPSLQEGIGLANGLKLAQSKEDIILLVRGFLMKEEADEEALSNKAPEYYSMLWGEVRRWRTGCRE